VGLERVRKASITWVGRDIKRTPPAEHARRHRLCAARARGLSLPHCTGESRNLAGRGTAWLEGVLRGLRPVPDRGAAGTLDKATERKPLTA